MFYYCSIFVVFLHISIVTNLYCHIKSKHVNIETPDVWWKYKNNINVNLIIELYIIRNGFLTTELSMVEINDILNNRCSNYYYRQYILIFPLLRHFKRVYPLNINGTAYLFSKISLIK